MEHNYDLAIVGGGIIGLAHATFAAEAGKKVLIIERTPKAYGASIRNFGLVWPIGQKDGPLFERTMKSREKWIDVSKKAGFWCRENGSLHLAYHEDEHNVLEEYATKFNNSVDLLSPNKVDAYSKYVNKKGLLSAIWSPTEMSVNPKKAIYAITEWLNTFPNVTLRYYEEVQYVETGKLVTNKSEYNAEQILICSGHDFQTLFPVVFAESGLIQSKLQMMRSYPIADKNFGATLCGGLTLTHYSSFAQCSGLSALVDRFENDLPDYRKWGIHVMINQNDEGELVIGDSHEYGFGFDPFNNDEVNTLILSYLASFLNMDELKIRETWYGVYSKHPEKTEFIANPMAGVRVITGLSGAGMTFSFGLANEQKEWFL